MKQGGGSLSKGMSLVQFLRQISKSISINRLCETGKTIMNHDLYFLTCLRNCVNLKSISKSPGLYRGKSSECFYKSHGFSEITTEERAFLTGLITGLGFPSLMANMKSV